MQNLDGGSGHFQYPRRHSLPLQAFDAPESGMHSILPRLMLKAMKRLETFPGKLPD